MSVVKRFDVNREQVLLDTGIFDVSANNNGAVFESLSDLLSNVNLDTLIPLTVRKGGMTIRFIQNSDNKYLQYRLMSTTWSTAVANWQGVDDEPTARSENLVKSGGVYANIGSSNTINRTTTSNQFINDYVIVGKNYIKTSKINRSTFRVIYSINKGSWETLIDTTADGEFHEFTIPSYTGFINVLVQGSYVGEFSVVSGMSKDIVLQEEETSQIKTKLGKINVLNKEEVSNYAISDYISVGKNYIKSNSVNSNTIKISYSIDGGSWIVALEDTISDGEFHEFTIPTYNTIIVFLQGTYTGYFTVGYGIEYSVVAKQDALSSGKNIKTVNGNSILGSGNLEISGGTTNYNGLSNKPTINNVELVGNKTTEELGLQEELVSGVNIATVNGSSILGGGNVSVADSIINNPDNVTLQEVGNVMTLKNIAKITGIRYGVIHVYGDVILTTDMAISWQECIVDIRGKVLITGSDTFRFGKTILWFNGGYFEANDFTGNIYTDNSTYIVAAPYQIFKGDIRVFSKNNTTGTPIGFKAIDAYAEWFGAKGDGLTPDGWAFNLLTENVICNNIMLLPFKTYVLERSIKIYNQNLIGCSGSKATKPALTRYPKFVDVPVISSILVENGEIHTFTVDTTNSTFANLEVGMSVSLVHKPGSIREIYNGRFIIKSINDGIVTVRGNSISKSYDANTMCLTSAYSLVETSHDNKCYNREIKGIYFKDILDLNESTAIYPLDRCFWETLSCVAVAGGKAQYNTKIVDCIVENALADAFEVGGDNMMIEHCLVKHCAANGIHLTGSYNVHIKDNFIFDTNINLLTGHNEGAITYSNCVSDVYITNNTFDCCLNGIGSISSADNCKSIITGNTFRNFRDSGINGDASVTEFGSVTQQFIIANNRFIATQDDIDNWESWYELTPLVVRSEASGYGIKFERSNSNAKWKNFVVNGNLFIDCGIYMHTVENVCINGNVISIDHVFTETVPSNIVFIDNSKGSMIGNTIHSNSAAKTNCFALSDSKVVTQINSLELTNCSINSDSNSYCTNNINI